MNENHEKMLNSRTTFYQQLKALLKRNILIKKRSRGRTLTEIIFPLYMIAIIIILKLTAKSISETAIPEPIGNGSNWLDPHLAFQNKTWLLAPNDSFTSLMIDNIKESMKQMNYPYYGSVTFNNSFNDAESCEHFYKLNSERVKLAVIFNNSYDGKNISYIIRMPFQSVPNSHNLLGSVGDCRSYPFIINCDEMKYYQNGFSFAQTVIDSAILKTLSKSEIIPQSKLLIYPKPEFISDNKLLESLIPTYMSWAFTPLVSLLVVMFVVEKERKIKEGMFMMGLRISAYWLSWIIVEALIVILISTVTTIILFSARVIKNINPFIIFILMTAYGMSMISVSALISPFFRKEKIAGSFASFFTIIAGLVHLLIVFLDIPVAIYYLLALLSPCAFSFGASALTQSTLELDHYIGFNNMFEDSKFSIGSAILMILFDTVFYLILSIYLDQVIPGEYGPKQSIFFFLNKNYWISPKATRIGYSMSKNIIDEYSDNEEVSDEMKEKTAIYIRNITKKYGNNENETLAVNNLSMCVYESQITGILGHNGAGKSTLINMLIGTIPPTSGSATIYGYDISDAKDMNILRSMFGVCLQQDILLDDLNAEEHLYFFGSMKGVKSEILNSEVKSLLTQVGLFNDHRTPSKNLSGGQKRKLCIAIALIGNPKIIILDEPTSGIDAYSRRKLWSLLQSYKQNRVIILTTHFMDEADILSDRKAIIINGKLRCIGSSLFLKNRFGIGYHLTVDVKNDVNVDSITHLIGSIIESSKFVRYTGSELFYILPHSETQNFSALFKVLENNIYDCNSYINSYGISMTTLEEVFLKLGEEVEESHNNYSTFDSDSIDMKSIEMNCEPTFIKSFLAFLRIRILIFIRNPMHIIPIIILPIIIIIISYVFMSKSVVSNSSADNLLLDFQIYNTNTVLSYRASNETNVNISLFNSMMNRLGVQTQLISTLSLNTLNTSYMAADIHSFIDDNSEHLWNFTLLFNDTYYHSLPILQNMMTNLYLSFMNKNESVNGLDYIQTYNYPFSQLFEEENAFTFNSNIYTYVIIIAIMLGNIPSSIAVEVVEDRESKIKDLLRVCGLTFSQYWITTIVCHLFMFSISTILILLVNIFILKLDFLQYAGAVVCVIIIFILFMPASLLASYILSYMFNKRDTARSVLPLICYLPSMMMIIAASIVTSINASTGRLLHQIFCIINPFYVPQGALFWISITSQMKNMVKFYNESEEISYFDWNQNIVICFLALILHIILFTILLPVIDIYKSGGNIYDLLCLTDTRKNSNITQHSSLEDEDVKLEREMVENHFSRGHIEKTPTVLIHNLRKDYLSGNTLSCRKNKAIKSKTVINNLNLMVESGHIFGLLGPNGAGKTSTIKIITNDEKKTHGTVMISGREVKSSILSLSHLIGYCPQHNALWKEITLREHLRLYASIRGIASQQINAVIDKFIGYLKLEEHIDKRAEYLSGGTKRKLCYLISLLGQPKLVLLDEPSTGMDPQAKRLMWKTVLHSFERNSNKSALLTTHSLEEADALCTKLAIMVNGVMRCIGSIQHLKNKYGAGYHLEIKWRHNNQAIESMSDRVKQLVSSILSETIVKEEYDNKIVFSVPQSSIQSLSHIFASLEHLRQTVEAIEEYSFSQSTIEQVFIDFAKQQNTEF